MHALVRATTDLWRLRGLPEVRMAVCDLNCRESTRAYVNALRPRMCYHFAWTDGRDLNSFDHTGFLRSSIDFAQALADSGCERFVGVGTVHEYGASQAVLTESSRLAPHNLHAASKTALATALRQIERRSGMKVTWVRPFYHYGPYEQPRRLVRSVIDALRQRRPARTTSGEQAIDYLHAEDAAAGICAAAREGLPVANICSGQAVAVRDVVLRIGQLLNAVGLLEIGALARSAAEPPFICGDNRLLRERTSWRPRFDLESGLRHTIEWWLAQGKAE